MNSITKSLKIIAFITAIMAVSSLASVGYIKINELKKTFYFGNNIIYKVTDILGISTETATVSADFSNIISLGSPLVFGGAHAPNLDHQDAWNKLKEIGITSIRRDFYIEYEIPNNTNLADFKANKNDIQNPKNWNWNKINETDAIYTNAKNRGIKTIGILSYAPPWLTHSGTNFGVPKDWEVYEYIIRELYKIHRKNLDYVEVWNELDLSLHVKNSGLSQGDAYVQIVNHASNAIRTVDNEINDGKKTPIIAGVVSSPLNSKYIQPLLEQIPNKNFDILSFHTYGHEQPVWSRILTMANQRGGIPIMITEWNQDTYTNKINPYIQTNIAIPYTAKQLISFLRNNILGANYFSLTINNPNKPNTVFSTFGIYRMINNKIVLFPQTKTWRLLSKTLGLGEGASSIYQIKELNIAAALAFKNSKSEYGLVLVNNQNNTKETEVTLSNLPISGDVFARAFIASENNDGSMTVGTNKLANINSKMTLKVIIPSQSVVGITLTTTPTLQEKVKSALFN